MYQSCHPAAGHDAACHLLRVWCRRAIFNRIVFHIDCTRIWSRVMEQQELTKSLADTSLCKIPDLVGRTGGWMFGSTILKKSAQLIQIFFREVNGCAIGK